MNVVVRRVAGAAICLLLGVVWFTVFRPASLGGPVTYLVIRGNSMEPTYHTGDLVGVRSAGTYAVGDIVAYKVPNGDIGAGHVVIHRITGGDSSSGFLMRGDNNHSVDPWMPRPADVVGSAWLEIPGFGRLLTFLHQPATLAALAVAAVVVVALRRSGTGSKASDPRRAPASDRVRAH